MLQVELNRMNEENQRLRFMLNYVSKNYGNLQMHLMSVMQQQPPPEKVFIEKLKNSCVVLLKLWVLQWNILSSFFWKVEEKLNGSSEGVKVDVAGPVQRQFLDLVPISSHGTDSQHSLSSDTRDADDVEETAKSINNEVLSKKRDVATANSTDKPRTCDVRVQQQQQQPGTDPAANSSTALNAQEKGHPDSPDHESWTANKAQKVANKCAVDQTEATIRKARVSVRARSEAPMVINCSAPSFFSIYISDGQIK